MKSYRRFLVTAAMLSTGWALYANPFNITFDAGYHGEIATGNATQSIAGGSDAIEPTVTPKSGYTFERWDQDTTAVSEDMAVKAVYEKIVSVTANSKDLVSLSLIPTETNIKTLFESALTDTGSYIKDQKGNYVRNIGGQWINSIGELDNKQGYLIFNNAGATYDVAIEGTSFDFTNTISLPSGYSIFPYLFEGTMDPELYFGSIRTSIDYVEALNEDMFSNTETGLTALQPGQSYLLKLTAARTFRFNMPFTPVSSPVSAPVDNDTITVTSPYDLDTVDGNPDWATATANGLTLREAIYFAEGLASGLPETINFDPSVTTVYLNDQISTATGEYTIDGDFGGDKLEDVTITRMDIKRYHRFLEVLGAQVTLNGLIIDNFQLDTNNGGAAILVNRVSNDEGSGNDGTLTAKYSTFSNNISENHASAIQTTKRNGDFAAVLAEISWCEFIGNTSSGTGQVLRSHESIINVSNSFFIGNNMVSGTATVMNNWGTLTLTNSSFVDTDADSAIYHTNGGNVISATNVTTVFDTSGSDVLDYSGSSTPISDTNGLHLESVTSEDYTTIDGVRFIETTIGSETRGAYAAYMLEQDNAPVGTAISDMNIEIDAVPTTYQTVFTDAEGNGTISSYAVSDDSGHGGISIDGSGLITIDEQQFSNGDVVNVSVTATDNQGKTSTAVTFQITFTVPIPASPSDAPVDGSTIIVTVTTDDVNDTTLTGFETTYSGDIEAKWDAVTPDGVTLREAVWFAEQRTAGNTDTITFHISLDSSSIELQDQLTIATGEFIIDGDLDNDALENITITNANGVDSRFMEITNGTVLLKGLIIDGFKFSNSPALRARTTASTGDTITFNTMFCTFSKAMHELKVH